MANLVAERHNTFWHDYKVLTVAGASAGIGLDALPPVRQAIGSGFATKTITLSCGKLATGVTVPHTGRPGVHGRHLEGHGEPRAA